MPRGGVSIRSWSVSQSQPFSTPSLSSCAGVDPGFWKVGGGGVPDLFWKAKAWAWRSDANVPTRLHEAVLAANATIFFTGGAHSVEKSCVIKSHNCPSVLPLLLFCVLTGIAQSQPAYLPHNSLSSSSMFLFVWRDHFLTEPLWPFSKKKPTSLGAKYSSSFSLCRSVNHAISSKAMIIAIKGLSAQVCFLCGECRNEFRHPTHKAGR